MLRLPFSFTFSLLLLSLWSVGQERDSIANKTKSFLIYPVGFYTPETGIGLGFASAINFYTKNENKASTYSSIQLGAAYTERNQLGIYLPFDIYLNKRRTQISGEIGYYDYVFYYFGTEKNGQVEKEHFSSRTPRLRFQFTRKLKDHLFFGFKAWYDDFRIYSYSENSSLKASKGNDKVGGIGIGPGVFVLFDTRDHIAAPSKGLYAEASYHHYTNVFERSFGFDRYRMDIRLFSQIKKGTLSSQLFAESITGDVPFFQMSYVGGVKRFRGYMEGRYRGTTLNILQVEWRHFPLNRWGYTLFAGVANVGQLEKEYFNRSSHPAFGLGIRYKFDYQKKVHLRLDAAFGASTPAIYFTIGEAF